MLYYVTDDDATGPACAVDEAVKLSIYTDYNYSTPQVLDFTAANLTLSYDDSNGDKYNPILVEHLNQQAVSFQAYTATSPVYSLALKSKPFVSTTNFSNDFEITSANDITLNNS